MNNRRNKKWLIIGIIGSLAIFSHGMGALNHKAYADVTPEVTGGEGYSLSLAANGTVWGWGNNSSGSLGDGTNIDRLTPVQVKGLLEGKTVNAISSRYMHSLAISQGAVYAWGINSSGQLGDGTNIDRKIPVKVGLLTGKTISSVATGMTHSLALSSTGTLYAWGNNDNGQLGDGSNKARSNPVIVSGFSGKKIVAIAAGNFHSVAVTDDGSVWAWGDNSSGQLGDGTTTSRVTPVRVIGLSGKMVTKVAAGYYHTLALVDDGTVWASGGNASGQLGDGTTTNRATSVKVSGLAGKTITDISAESDHSLALVNDHSMMSWGGNDEGQLGDGTMLNQSTPVNVMSGKLIYDVSSGTHHSLAVDDHGVVWTWGGNNSGELGDGTTDASLSAVHSLADVAVDKAALTLGFGTNGLTGVVENANGVTENITLSGTGANGSTITWASNDPTVVIGAGEAAVTRQAAGDTNVILTATLSNGSTTDTITFPIKVLQTDAGAVADAKAALEIGFYGADTGTSVTRDVYLPTSGSNGTVISWSSTNPAISVIGTKGVVSRPVTPAGSSVGNLQATITKNGQSADTKIFAITVPEQSVADAIAEAETALAVEYYGTETAANVLHNVTLPTTGLNGTTVTWASDHPDVIIDSASPAELLGVVVLPDNSNTVVTLTATVSKNGVNGLTPKTFALTVPQTDVGAIAQTKASVTLVTYGGSDTGASVTESLTLKTSDTNGTTITWSSNTPTVLSNAGVVTRPTAANVNVILTATIKKNAATATLAIPLTVIQTDEGTIPAAKAALAITYATGDSASKVTRDLTLPSSGLNGTVITWSSDKPAVVSASGVVTGPTDVDTTVVLTATLTKNAVTATKTFSLKVLQSDASAVAAAKAALAIVYSAGDTFDKVTKKLTLATAGTSGTKIVWSSDTPAVVSTSGVVIRKPDADANVVLTATITKTSIANTPVTETKTFPAITVLQSELGAINEEKEVLVLGYSGGETNVRVTQNLTLPITGMNDTTIKWASNSPTVISTGGVVKRPTTADKAVVLTATIRKGAAYSTKAFTLNVPQTEESAVAAAKTALIVGFARGDKVTSVTQNLSLTTTGAKGTTIVWDSSVDAAISDSGVVTRQTNGNTLVTLQATISKNGVSDTKSFIVTVPQTDTGAVTDSKAALAVGYSSGDTSSTVTKKVTLPVKGINGATISWDSTEPKVISKAGAVVRQPNGDTTVKLTATIKKNGSTDSTSEYTLVVLQSDAGAIAAAKTAVEIGYNNGDTATNVTHDLTLPSSGTNGTTVSWISSNPTVVSSTGGITQLTTKDSKVTLTALIKKNTTVVRKAFVFTVPQTDAGSTAAAKAILAVGYARGDKAARVTQNLTLPLTGSNGASVTWSSSDPSVVSNSGIVARKSDADTNINLTATISKNGVNDTKVFSMVVPQTDEGSVAAAKTALAIGYTDGETSSRVTKKITLLKLGASTTTIVWTSDSPAISSAGTVTRQAAGDKTVTLHATIKKNGITDTKVFVLNVPQSDLGAVNADKAILVVGYAAGDSASYVTQNLTLAASGTSGTTITWVSSVPAVVSNSGVVTPVSGKKTSVRLTATITKNGATSTKAFTLSV
jgi:alpha-tubulin suppressor-like RCC1 family protein